MRIGFRYLLIACFFVSLLPSISWAKVTTCPPLEFIKRTPGQNSWNSLYPGWDGRFDSPQLGQGYSTDVDRFAGARWVQLNNLPDSPGKMECNYEGNYQDEIIRFDQASYFSTKKPSGDYWNCKISGEFPSTTCECTMGIDYCSFDSDAHEVNTSTYFEDTTTLLDQEFHK